MSSTLNTLLAGIVLLLLAGTALAQDQSVGGYYRRDGTYVAPYHRTTPNQYRYDNYSSQGNFNPWTGQPGSARNEWSNPPAFQPLSPYYSPYAPRRR